MSTAPSPMLPVQGALHSVLSGDSTLGALIEGIYDYLPEDVPYPFVHLGEAVETPDNRHGGFGRQTVPTLHVWDQYRGYARVLRIGARITELLDHQPLTIPGHDWIATRFEFSQTLTDPEPPGNIRHLVLRYRVVTEQHP
ncbi:DUF3168 domain-containing protein [Streptomyces sp. MCL20-2]|uniref:DUF3168 domain-containing protein n=1 Tax=Streptomyces sp. MCL20-2 TaxID=2967219 RepID=UPI002966F38D|nr:DUF3168 domain-containing protein [Streptomyces sp. MCL20-2]